MSTVVQRFLSSSSTAHPDRAVVTATIDDAPHFSVADKARIVASYMPHELEARTKGVPVLGSGRIFPVKEETLAIEHREFPRHWARIGGMDFGWGSSLCGSRAGLGSRYRHRLCQQDLLLARGDCRHSRCGAQAVGQPTVGVAT
jgi:hypothetical protein